MLRLGLGFRVRLVTMLELVIPHRAMKYILGAAAPSSRRTDETYGLADHQSIKKPILSSLVLSRPDLNMLIVTESITC